MWITVDGQLDEETDARQNYRQLLLGTTKVTADEWMNLRYLDEDRWLQAARFGIESVEPLC